MNSEYHSHLARLGTLSPPATEQDIELTKRQNMCRSSESYKEFVVICNGFLSNQTVALYPISELEGLNTAYHIRFNVPALLLNGTAESGVVAMLDWASGAIYPMPLGELGLPRSAVFLVFVNNILCRKLI